MISDIKILSDILTPQQVRFSASAQSKKKAFEQIAELFTTQQESVGKYEIFDGLVARERLGNTGLGHGVGLPHCRLEGLEKPIACFMHFRNGIDYDAMDKVPVDLLFSLLVPIGFEEEHLSLLAEISRILHEESVRLALRGATSAKELYQRLIDATQ
jgi:PTS system nitrogen regulatory IIA component